MTNHLTLEAVDVDGAIQEALDESQGETRSGFLKKAVFTGGTLAFGGVIFGGLPSLVTAAPSPSQDAAILNFALVLEYLESSFYMEAVAEARSPARPRTSPRSSAPTSSRTSRSSSRRSARRPARSRRSTSRARPPTRASSIATAIALEDVGVGAYNGQGQNLTKATLGAAATIVSVEARHAAWIRDIAAKDPAPNAFDPLFTKQQTLAKVKATGFVKS